MIDRDQVLHVARLARLRLTDEELERMPGELTKILEHVEKMDELDLDGVEPVPGQEQRNEQRHARHRRHPLAQTQPSQVH